MNYYNYMINAYNSSIGTLNTFSKYWAVESNTCKRRIEQVNVKSNNYNSAENTERVDPFFIGEIAHKFFIGCEYEQGDDGKRELKA